MPTSAPTCVANLADLLLADKNPLDLALLTTARDYTYGDLQEASQAISEFLSSVGARHGDRVVIVSDNSFFSAVAYLGALAAGLVSVPLPATTTRLELEQALQRTEPKAAFLQASAARTYDQLPADLFVVLDKPIAKSNFVTSCTFSDLLAHFGGKAFASVDVGEDSLAALMFTSGSTGAPRAVMVSHGNIAANTESIIEYLALTKSDRIMAVLPFHYCFGASLLHTHLRVGASLVLDNRFLYPDVILDRMVEMECTGFAGVPSHYQILLKSSGLRHRSFPSLRYIQQAGGYLPPQTIFELQEALPQTEVFVMYGQTEATARLSYLPPEALREKNGSIGKGIAGVRLSVLNEAGLPVLPGENGEIVAEGKNIAAGYWRDPEETAATFRDGKLHTGDIATVDQDGFIYIVDRAKDFLKCGGKRISCRQIEQQILSFPDLSEAAVIGVPDPLLGEAVKLFVVPQSASDDLAERLQAFCKHQLPPHQIPQEIVILQQLPKNEAGKVSKHLLKKL